MSYYGQKQSEKADFVNKNNRLNQLWDSRGKIVRAPDYVTLFSLVLHKRETRCETGTVLVFYCSFNIL